MTLGIFVREGTLEGSGSEVRRTASQTRQAVKNWV